MVWESLVELNLFLKSCGHWCGSKPGHHGFQSDDRACVGRCPAPSGIRRSSPRWLATLYATVPFEDGALCIFTSSLVVFTAGLRLRLVSSGFLAILCAATGSHLDRISGSSRED